MKRVVLGLVMVALVAGFAVANGQQEGAAYEDGVYFAAADEFSAKSGWKSTVTLMVENGKIVEADWNAAHKEAGTDKKTRSADGEYGMVAYGDAQAEWHVQAEKAEAWLLENQDPTGVALDGEGHTDAIAGVSIAVSDFFELAQEALAKGPVGYGPYKDGVFFAEMPEFSHGYKYNVTLTVISGRIMAVYWDGEDEKGVKNKKAASMDGDYGMVENGGAQAPWYEQAELAEAYLLKTQDPTDITYKDEDGHTDDIAGVTIHPKEMFMLAEEALEMR